MVQETRYSRNARRRELGHEDAAAVVRKVLAVALRRRVCRDAALVAVRVDRAVGRVDERARLDGGV